MKQYRPVFAALSIAVILYLIHKLALCFFKSLRVENPYYPVEQLYLFFASCSIVIIIILIKTSRKSYDNVGMVFMIATSTKMVLCYFMLRPVLKTAAENIRIEKISFFMMFILFLAIETVITIRILNNRQ